MLKILLIAPTFGISHQNRVQAMMSAYKTALNLAKYAHVIVLAAGETPHYERVHEHLEVYRLKNIYLRDPINYMIPFSIFWHTIRLARKEKPDVFLVNKFMFFNALVIPLLKLMGKKVYVQIDAFPSIDWVSRTKWIRPIMWLYLRLIGIPLLRMSDCVILLHEGMVPIARRYGLTYHVIHNGINPKEFAHPDIAPEVKKSDPQTVHIGFIGRLESMKGYDVLLTVCQKILPAYPQATLFMIGNTKGKEKVVAQYEGNQIKFLGIRTDVPSVLAGIDIFVLPSFSEGLSNSLMEAMAAGCAVIATQSDGGNRILIHDRENGLFARRDDAADLKEKIQYLLDHPKHRQAFGAQAKALIQQEFNWNILVQEYLRLFEQDRSGKLGDQETQITSILEFVPFYTPYIGGMINHSEEFTKAFAAKGIHVTVVAPALRNFPLLPDEPRIRMVYYPAHELITHFPIPKVWTREFWQAWRSLKDRDYDCVFSRTRFFLITLVALIYARMKKLPWIHIEHGADHMQRIGNPLIKFFAQFYDATIGHLVLRSCDRVVAIAPGVYDFVARYGRKDAPIIYRGLDLPSYERIPPDFRMKNRYPGKVIVAWAGRMSSWKGVEHIIKAVAILSPSLRDMLQCILIGDGEKRARLEKMSAGLPVTFLGSTPRQEVIALLKATDIFIHSSHPGGGLSTSLLEAMACNNAIIASPHEGGRNVIIDNENGLLMEDTTPEYIAARLTLLLDHPLLRKQLGMRAYHSIKDRFSWDATVEKYLRVIKSIAHS